MAKKTEKSLSDKEIKDLILTLKTRFEKNMNRHEKLNWMEVQQKLESDKVKLWSLNQMEISGGEPDVIDYDKKLNKYIFYDCSPESPKGRRSLCYDKAALIARKEFKPANNVIDVAQEIGIELLTEIEYKKLQELGDFDTKTSSWIFTPENIRTLGGAIFCDKRYNTVFVYHNGAESYYAARGFRAKLIV